MTQAPDGGAYAPALTSGHALPTTYGGWFGPSAEQTAERDRLTAQARETDAGRQLQRCFSRWTRLLDHVRLSALTALAANRPVATPAPQPSCASRQPCSAAETTRTLQAQIARRRGFTGANPRAKFTGPNLDRR